VQQAFADHDALQCGYCTPGMIMNAIGLLNDQPTPSREDIILGMEDNLCRCGAHNRILDAIEAAAKEMQNGK
jgi:carbon-monoxide dehydrogenase small subunit